MAELADAYDSGSYERKFLRVQVPFPAPYRVFITNLNVGNEHSIFHLHFCVGLSPLFFITLFSKVRNSQ